MAGDKEPLVITVLRLVFNFCGGVVAVSFVKKASLEGFKWMM